MLRDGVLIHTVFAFLGCLLSGSLVGAVLDQACFVRSQAICKELSGGRLGEAVRHLSL